MHDAALHHFAPMRPKFYNGTVVMLGEIENIEPSPLHLGFRSEGIGPITRVPGFENVILEA